jgi:phosphoserine phosphatase
MVRLKRDIPRLVEFLTRGIDGCRFSFYVISAAPQEVIQSALESIVPANHIYGTVLEYDGTTGEVTSIVRVPAGFGKVAVIEEIAAREHIGLDRIIYVGDGHSDLHSMLHVNNGDGFTISVSDNRRLAQVAKRTVLSDSAFSVVLPILEHVFGWHSSRIRTLFQSYGLPVQEWERIRTDLITFGEAPALDVPRVM